MTFLELFSLIASAATIFALIVGVFSVWNGRMTRREIGGLIAREEQATRQATRELMAELAELITREAQATRELIERLERGFHQVLSRQTEILGRIDERIR
jgi:hypothetical protein